MRKLLQGKPVLLSALFPEYPDFSRAAKSAKTIYKKVKEFQEERGIDVDYLAIGTVSWDTGKGAVPSAPLLLREHEFIDPPSRSGECRLQLAEFSDINHALLRALNAEHGLDLTGEDFADLLAEGGDAAEEQIAHRLRTLVGSKVDLRIGNRYLLGTFSFAKLPMVRDIEQSGQLLAESTMVRAICGDLEAQRSVRGTVPEPGSHRNLPAADEFLVFDADASQSRAVDSVVGGVNLLIDGPPGTGKSQTIANLIATLSARGKKVLFVAEKRAAIDAVVNRIGKVGLSGLVMDIHGGAGDRRAIAKELAAALESARTAPMVPLDRLHRSLDGERAQLDQHAAAMHRHRAPWDISLYDAQTKLIALGDHANGIRFQADVLRALAGAELDTIRERLRRYVDLGGLEHPDQGPWLGAQVRTTGDLNRVLGLLHSVRDRSFPAAISAMDRVRYQARFRPLVDLPDWERALQQCVELARSLETLRPEAYESDLYALMAASAPRRWRKQHGIDQPHRERRNLLKWARALARAKLDNRSLHAALAEAVRVRSDWQRRQTEQAGVALPNGVGEAAETFAVLRASLNELAPYFNVVRLGRTRIDELRDALAALLGDDRTPYRLVELHQLRCHLTAAGLGPLLRELTDRGMDGEQVLLRFDYAWHASILDQARRDDPAFGAFNGTALNSTVRSFQEHDTEHINSNASRVRRITAERLYSLMDTPRMSAQETLLKAQAKRKRGNKPIRDLLAEAGELLLELKPVWAMSPLVVSQVLPQRRMFDVVIFDEASQIPTSDAIPAIMRAAQTVVAGDPRQLPPTNFFKQMEQDEDEDQSGTDLSVATGYESILDALHPLLNRCSLTWHYRSRNERLIAFANAWIYDRSLTTFPGATETHAVRHYLVDGDPTPGDEDSSTAEVTKVVELIAEHATARPHESLGVITFGIKHADRIEAALQRARDADPKLDRCLSAEGPEPFFVKNLERVQGDERDAIILSTGYGRGANGRVGYNFGPINQEGGERRLNVAVTRAKQRMMVVSSFTCRDLHPNRLLKEGPKQLRAYLEFAESGGTSLGSAIEEHPPLNPFEIDVRNRLTSAGIPLTAQYGASGYRIDFAASHPDRLGEMVLAIEADGATYHSSYSARDRDRLRQQHLERLGWRFHRIWSTDWFRDPDSEVRSARAAYDRAVEWADEQHRKPPEVPEPVAEPSQIQAARAEPPERTLPRPVIEPGAAITEYSGDQLVMIVRWVDSDGFLRTDDELLRETAEIMGYRQIGSRIRDALSIAVRAARRK